MSSLEWPEASIPTIIPTVTRIPRMRGLPPMMLGSNVILVSFMIFILSRMRAAREQFVIRPPTCPFHRLPAAIGASHPAIYDGATESLAGNNEMRRVCLNRHNGAVNSAFLDWSIRRMGLKELWTLKWNRTFDVSGAWTLRGGVQPEDWPQWMRGMKDY
jgi:prepilin-type processing-associated H-X9-DG protein